MSQPSLIVDSETYPFLHSNCHHQFIYAKCNFKVRYRRPNDDLVRREINHFSRGRGFENKNVDPDLTFKQALLNVLSPFIPDEYILCNGKKNQ